MDNKNFNLKAGGLAILLIMLIFFGFWAFSSTTNNGETSQEENRKTSVSLIKVSDLGLNGSKLSVNGKVESEDQAILSSEVGGRVRGVPVSIGQSVSAGQILVSFDTEDAALNLAEAEAGLASQEARLADMRSGSLEGEIRVLESAVETAEADLEKVMKDTKEAIENAKRNLLNNDLRAYLADEDIYIGEDDNIEPPGLSGTYEGEEGEYEITLYRSQTQSGYSFRYEGPEGAGTGVVSTKVPQPLGKGGLYITFPDNFANRYNVEWVVPIPNERGAGYLSVKEAYRSAKDDREPAIKKAQENLKQRKEELEMARLGSRKEQIAAQEAQVRQAEARVEAARSQLNKRELRAPFSGTVSKVSVRSGENVGAGQEMVSLINKNFLNINVQVSPNEARLISVGDLVLVSDGYEGLVTAMSGALDPATGQVEVKITVDDEENDLIVGENVESDILTGSKENSILVPLSAVEVSSAGNAVFTIEEGKVKRVSVSLGSVEGDRINITEGLEGLGFIIEDTSSVRSGQSVEIRGK
ncbi:MAG: efflux RND transporter periplasmic adaptor subunit [Patescibacteria group bacterium]